MRVDFFHKNLIFYSKVLFLLINVNLINSQFPDDDHTQSPLDPMEDENYIRLIFENGTENYFRNWECPDGIWAEDYFKMNPAKCACVKGAFLLSKTLCDEEFEILTGNEHCFDLAHATIRKFTPLTGPMGLRGRASTVFRSDAPYVARLVSPTPTTTVNEPVNYVFRLNDPHEFSSYAILKDGSSARLGCLEAQTLSGGNTSADAVMQVAELPQCAVDFRGHQSWCKSSLGKYIATIKVGSKWGPKSSGSGALYPGGCASGASGRTMKSNKPLAKPRHRRASKSKSKTSAAKTAAKNPIKAYKPPPQCNEFDPEKIEPPAGGSPSVEHFVDRAEYPHRTFHTTSLHQSEVNTQTSEVVKNLLAMSLADGAVKSDSSHKLGANTKIVAFRHIQLSRLITEKVCQNEDIDLFLTSAMVRIFRLMYLDILEKYPYPEVLVDNSTINRDILTGLKECLKTTPNISFLPNDTCHNSGPYGTNVSETVLIYGTNLSMPSYVQFNTSSMDFPIETVWKMMMLVHYFCASNFSNPTAHSEYVVKTEAFLRNPAFLYRWYHPGAANAAFKLVLSAFNLKKFATALDRCVATAKGISPYTVWLRRPAEVLTWKPKFNGPSDVSSTTPSSARPPKSGRRRRSAFYYQNNFWDDQAYCMSNSKSIVSEVQTSFVGTCKMKPAWFQNTD